MTMNNAEHNYSDLHSPENQLIDPVQNYFRALRTSSYGMLKESAEILQETGLPFSREIDGVTSNLEAAWLRAEGAYGEGFLKLLRKDAFAAALRLYAYSGVQLDSALVWMTADYVDVDKTWVRNSIRPTPRFIFDHGIPYRSRKVVRSRGHDALQQLDLLPSYGGRLMKILDARLQ